MPFQIELLDPRTNGKRRFYPCLKAGKLDTALVLKGALKKHGVRARVRPAKVAQKSTL